MRPCDREMGTSGLGVPTLTTVSERKDAAHEHAGDGGGVAFVEERVFAVGGSEHGGAGDGHLARDVVGGLAAKCQSIAWAALAMATVTTAVSMYDASASVKRRGSGVAVAESSTMGRVSPAPRLKGMPSTV